MNAIEAAKLFDSLEEERKLIKEKEERMNTIDMGSVFKLIEEKIRSGEIVSKRFELDEYDINKDQVEKLVSLGYKISYHDKGNNERMEYWRFCF